MGRNGFELTSTPICARRSRRYSEMVVVDMRWGWMEKTREDENWYV